MYEKRLKYKVSNLKSVPVTEGERIEDKVRRVQHNGEAITDGAPEIYTERGKGVQAAYNIRTDRWEIAADAMDKVHRVNPKGDDKWGDGKVVDMTGKEQDSGASESGSTSEKA